MGVQNLVTQCRTVLLMVHELHGCGYQRLRAIPEMERSGKYWRCAIAPASAVSAEHGARLTAYGHDPPPIATYSSREQNQYFAWTDVYPYAAPNELARYFLERFPDVAEAGKGADWQYAGWYMEMLRLTQPDRFPYTAARGRVPDTYIPTASPIAGGPHVRIPLPPPGEAQAEQRQSLPPVWRPGRNASSRPARRVSGTVTRRRIAV